MTATLDFILVILTNSLDFRFYLARRFGRRTSKLYSIVDPSPSLGMVQQLQTSKMSTNISNKDFCCLDLPTSTDSFSQSRKVPYPREGIRLLR